MQFLESNLKPFTFQSYLYKTKNENSAAAGNGLVIHLSIHEKNKNKNDQQIWHLQLEVSGPAGQCLT